MGVGVHVELPLDKTLEAPDPRAIRLDVLALRISQSLEGYDHDTQIEE